MLAERLWTSSGVSPKRCVHRERHALGKRVATFVALLYQTGNHLANIQELSWIFPM